MPLVTAECVILQVFAYGDTSKILKLLTSNHGVRSAIAKGALRPRSRYGGMVEAFSEGIATLYLKDGREIQTLSAFELTASHQALGNDLIRFGGASLLAEIVLRTASEEAQPGIHEGVRAAMRRLESSPTDQLEAVVLSEAWRLIGRLGFAPALQDCIACGRTLAADQPTTFDYTAGGVRCDACTAGSAGRPIPGRARADLVRLGQGAAVRLERTEAHWRLLARYLAHHVLDGAQLRSLDFLAATIATGSCAS
jgi:DNA repair protein RecO (recombination protein O)